MGRRQWVILLALIAGMYLMIRFVLPFIAPFVIGLLFASLAEPLVAGIEKRWGWSRNLATWLIFLLFIVAILGLLFWAIGGATREIKTFIAELPKRIAEGKTFIDWVNRFLIQRWNTPSSDLQRLIFQAAQNLLEFGSRSMVGLAKTLEWLPSIFGTILLSMMSAFFFIRDKAYWLTFARRVTPPAFYQTINHLVDELFGTVLQIIRMEFMLMTMVFLSTGATLSWLGYERPWFLGLVLGILEPLPMMGPSAVLLPWSGWLLATGQWKTACILMALCGLFIILRQWSELHFIGGKLGLNPLWTLVGIYLGFKCFGLVGLAMGPMIFVVIRRLFVMVSENNNPTIRGESEKLFVSSHRLI